LLGARPRAGAERPVRRVVCGARGTAVRTDDVAHRLKPARQSHQQQDDARIATADSCRRRAGTHRGRCIGPARAHLRRRPGLRRRDDLLRARPPGRSLSGLCGAADSGHAAAARRQGRVCMASRQRIAS
jgi:hypothetical protein